MLLLLLAVLVAPPQNTVDKTYADLWSHLPASQRLRIDEASLHLDDTHYENSARAAARNAFPNATPSELDTNAFLIIAHASVKAERDLRHVRHEINNLEMEKSMIRDEMDKKRISEDQLQHDMDAVDGAEQLQQARLQGLIVRRAKTLDAAIALMKMLR